MTWQTHHTESERLAGDAEMLVRRGDYAGSQQLFQRAAEAEMRALEVIGRDKQRTYGVTAVSAVALWYKARELKNAERVAHEIIAQGSLTEFAIEQLRLLLQMTWNEEAAGRRGVRFAPGQVLVAIKGGDVVHGGAPIDLVLDKVQTVQSMFYRAVELLKNMPLRRAGPPSAEIRDACRPWLFQSVPGSYQFSVMVQQPRQADFFREDVSPRIVADTFLSILRAETEGDQERLAAIVPDVDYRKTFLKLARNLAPSGRSR